MIEGRYTAVFVGLALLVAAPAAAQQSTAAASGEASGEASVAPPSVSTDERPPVHAPVEPDDDAPRLEWTYPRFRIAQYGLTFGLPTLFRIINHNTDAASAPRWRGGILFDDVVQDALPPKSRKNRDLVERVSDYMWYGSMALPIVDTLLTALVIDQNPEVAWQMTMINLQALALNGFVTLLSIRVAARERPAEGECRDDPDYIALCDSGPLNSFPSGHTSGAFTGAGLMCAHHTNLPLYGGGAADTAACIGALGVATATGIMRVMAERHYLSDVIVGAGIGLASGWLVPWLLHYRHDRSPDRAADASEEGETSSLWFPYTDGEALGIGAIGLF